MNDTTEQSSGSATSKSSNPYLLPGAIVIAALVIGGAIIMRGSASPLAGSGGGSAIEAEVMPVRDIDHVSGGNKPDVYFVEYADYQCVYCERFHNTVKNILNEYNGKVAWVYRHFPLESIHPEARPAAVASECIAEQGGNDAFFKFTDKIFADQKSMSKERYSAIAGELGLDRAAFEECLASGKYDQRIDDDTANAMDLGGQGTPFTVLLTREGNHLTFSGALPESQVRTLVDRALKTLE